MSLSFLSKKSWHVANVSNVEKVWLAEQKLEQEKKKLEEYTHTLKEERQKEELLRLQQEQGLVAPRKERVDFLYEQQETAASASLVTPRRRRSHWFRTWGLSGLGPAARVELRCSAHVRGDPSPGGTL